ncbi:MAG: hypothetical protein ACE5NM_02100 [Sedimentisphaerales bacterium]
MKTYKCGPEIRLKRSYGIMAGPESSSSLAVFWLRTAKLSERPSKL